jgi:iron complex transport system substrate-binding protein
LIRRVAQGGRLLVLLLLGLAALAAACGDGGESEPAAAGGAGDGFPRTVVDSSGAEVVIEALPQRVISYSPGATEILFAIGAGERVVATDLDSDYPAEARELPKLDAFTVDPEAALALEPDLVLFSFQTDQIAQFGDLGMTVLLVEPPQTVEGVYEQILLLSTLTGAEREAQALVASMRERVEAVRQALADVEQGPRVFFELDATLFTIGERSFIGNMLATLKARNIAAAAASAFPQLSAEAVIAADPEVILLADAAEFGYGDESAESVAARPGWGGIAAVVDGRVHAVDPDIISRPGPRIVEGLEAMARLLHPDRFD